MDREKQREANRRSYRKHKAARQAMYRELARKRRESDPGGYAAYQKAWSDANRDRVNQKKRERRSRRSPEQVEKDRAAQKAYHRTPEAIEKKRAYYAANKDKWRAKYREWSAANPGKEAARANRRRTAVAIATPAWANQEEIQKFYEEAARRRAKTGIPHDVDHIIPLRGHGVCGLHCEHNLQVITESENASKGNKWQ